MKNKLQEQNGREIPACMYCGASLKKKGQVKGFSIVCLECKAML